MVFKDKNWVVLLCVNRNLQNFVIIKTSYRYIFLPSVLILMIHYCYMTDPILFISMILGLGGVFVLINSFSDDDDGDNDGGKGTYIYNLEPVKVGNN